jgi:uncharacterized protein (TIGR02118 family)
MRKGTDMIKMSLFLTRRADLTFEQFSDYWQNTHWPIVIGLRSVKENTRRYVQQHSIGGVPDGLTAAPYDGYAEAWFDDLAALERTVTSPEWKIVQQDDLNFLDTSKTVILFTKEKVTYEN